MERIINISGIDIPFKCTASTARRYRAKFNRDLFSDIQKLQKKINDSSTNKTEIELSGEDLEIFENLAHTMALQADDTITQDTNEWLDQFGDMMAIANNVAQILDLWNVNAEEISKTKKKV